MAYIDRSSEDKLECHINVGMTGALRGGVIWRLVFIYSPHHMHICVYLQHIPCLHILFEALPTTDADLFFEITKAQMVLHSASIQAAVPLWSPTWGFYLVILLFHCIPLRGAMQHPEGRNKYPGPFLSSTTHSRQWRQERRQGGRKNGPFYVWTTTEGNLKLTIYCNDEPN